jgi:hypothetical protein
LWLRSRIHSPLSLGSHVRPVFRSSQF